MLVLKAYEIVSPDGVDALKLTDRPSPAARATDEILVRVHASSVTYRDLLTDRGSGFATIYRIPRIPNSDCAGEVIGVGPWRIGISRLAIASPAAFFNDGSTGR